jgi:hypothetical protein
MIQLQWTFQNFTFFLEKGLVIADEKAHQGLYCIGGDHDCSECDSEARLWALSPYTGKNLSLSEVNILATCAHRG